jgi:4-hydroxy-4-methyl-2-oxoglutarate aldolase
VPVICAGVLVRPGDIVIGDDEGVVVVPREMAFEIAAAATAYLEKENLKRATLHERYIPYGVKDELEARGYQFN